MYKIENENYKIKTTKPPKGYVDKKLYDELSKKENLTDEEKEILKLKPIEKIKKDLNK